MEKVNDAIIARMKIFLRLKAFYNFMELAEITKKRRHEDKKNTTYVHRNWKWNKIIKT